MTLFRATADIGALFVVGEQPALLWVFRRKWNADFGGSGTWFSAEVEHRFREVEHRFREVEHRFRTKWNVRFRGRERSSVA